MIVISIKVNLDFIHKKMKVNFRKVVILIKRIDGMADKNIIIEVIELVVNIKGKIERI